MNTPNKSNTKTDFTSVLAKINEIVKKSADDDYIYRGEKECYKEVCSGLYRARPNTEGVDFDIGDYQKKALEEARKYIGKESDEGDNLEILTELQHFGGKTNLIDFTEDYLIALFFACDGSHDKDGRVIFLKRESDDYEIRKPRTTIDRVKTQKSIFVEPCDGYVKPEIVVPISAALKRPMLDYLQKYHDISLGRIYNDLHGFIKRSTYGEHLNGLEAQRNADETKDLDDKKQYYNNAIRHYTEAIELNMNPEFVGPYNNRAVSYRSIGKLDTAIEDCDEAVKLNPKREEAHIIRGLVYSDEGEFDIAIENYNEAIALNRNSAIAYNNRGVAYYQKGEFDIAVENFDEAIALKPDYAVAHNGRGVVYYAKGEFDIAIENHNKAIALDPDYVKAHYNRGNAYSAKGEFDIAIENYNKAIALDPQDALPYYNRAITYNERGEFNNIIRDYNKAIELNPELAEAYDNRGDVWLRLSEWDKARADLITAKEKGIDIVVSFCRTHKTVADFEAKHDVRVPEDIAALLQRK